MAGNEELEAELEALRRGWLDRLEGRLLEIDRGALALSAAVADRAAVESLRLLLHRLAGTGASFGFPEVTHAARTGENIVRKPFDEARPPTESEIAELKQALELLRVAVGKAIATRPR
jgi:chemotaxis protein histidine kinase CheA